MKEIETDLVSFAQESKNPTLKELTKKADNALKAKENTEIELSKNQNDLNNCETELTILENGSDYIEKVKELSDDKYDAFLKLLNIKSFDPAALATNVDDEYKKRTETYNKNIFDLKEKISDNQLKIENYDREYNELSDNISDYKMKLAPLVDLLILASDDSATNRQRAEEVIDTFDELKDEKRELCTKIIFPDAKFRNAIKRVFVKNEKKEEETDIKETKVTNIEVKEEEKSFNDIIIPIVEESVNSEEKKEENNLVKQIFEILDKNKINYNDVIEEFTTLDEIKALSIMKVFDILENKGISLDNFRYSADKLLNVDTDKFNTLLNDLLSVKPKNDVALAISGLLDPTINVDDVRDKIVNDSTLSISELIFVDKSNYDDIFKGEF